MIIGPETGLCYRAADSPVLSPTHTPKGREREKGRRGSEREKERLKEGEWGMDERID